jgi:DNA transformation protein and related proteins
MTRSPRYDRQGNEGGPDDGDKMDREAFEDWALNRLSELGDITSRPMFGGHGIYWRDVIFGMVFRDRLYFKVDDQSKGEYLARGMGPLRPNERQTLKSYFEVPPEILDDRELLLSWAKEAIRAGQVGSSPLRVTTR